MPEWYKLGFRRCGFCNTWIRPGVQLPRNKTGGEMCPRCGKQVRHHARNAHNR